MTFRRYAPRPYAKVQAVRRMEDPRGEEWGFGYFASGAAVEVHAQKLTSTEVFSAGRTNTTNVVRLTGDLPAPFTEADFIEYPAVSPAGASLNTSLLWDVTKVVPYESRGVFVAEIQR